MSGRSIIAAAFSLFISESALAQWKPEDFNPKWAEQEDMVLPIPCGGYMAFRRVDVPTDGFGGLPRFNAVAGSFSDQQVPGFRHFWMGKYEVTYRQFMAVTAGPRGNCPAPQPEFDRRPMVYLTFGEAIRFTEEYSAWLHANPPMSLPREGEFLAHVRLPTEGEWEFAARGGSTVSPDAFMAPLFPEAQGRLEEFARHRSAASAITGLGNIGLLEPNPLGLHDILGNASELVLDGFRREVDGHLVGHTGGAVIRGGDIYTATSDLTTAYRHEWIPLLPGGGANRQDAVGFRVILSVPATSDRPPGVRHETGPSFQGGVRGR